MFKELRNLYPSVFISFLAEKEQNKKGKSFVEPFDSICAPYNFFFIINIFFKGFCKPNNSSILFPTSCAFPGFHFILFGSSTYT